MRTLDLYIAKTLLLAILMVLLVLGGLDLMFSLFDELSATNAGYQIKDAIVYSFLTLPRRLYELLPFSALIGALAGLGTLASSNELVVMQAAGVKIRRIVWAVMKPGFCIMVFGLCLGEFIAPALELKAEISKAVASGKQMMVSKNGYWERDRNQFMHFNAIGANGTLYGVKVYEVDDDQRRVSDTVASYAEFDETLDLPGWVLINGSKTVFPLPESDEGAVTYAFERLDWDVDLSPELLQVLILDSDKMAISDLYRYARHFIDQEQDASQYLVAFWKKLLQPFTTAALILVAVSFIFGPLREATMGYRVFTAICFGLIFRILQSLLSTLSLVVAINPLIAVIIPIILALMLGGLLLKRAS